MKGSYPKLRSIKWKSGAYADNIALHPKYGRKGIPVVDVLTGALNARLKEVTLIGYEQDGSVYLASSVPDVETAYFMACLGADLLLNPDN